jgi:deazaflavin-dependent oxidoreductase (nitroreductase family)
VELSRTVAGLDFCYLTTTGRSSGLERTIEIWFALNGTTVYLLSGGRDHSDWVKNIRRDGRVKVKLGRRLLPGRARILEPGDEDALARRLLAAKYQDWREGKRLSGWARNSLPVAIDLVPATERSEAAPA